jgi:hypothetical protein
VKREQVGSALAVLAGILGIVTIVTRPFLFGMIATLVLLAATKLTASRRLTAPAAAIVGIGALAGAAIAVGFTQPLY